MLNIVSDSMLRANKSLQPMPVGALAYSSRFSSGMAELTSEVIREEVF